MPMWRNAIPYRQSPETPNVGTWAQTDDTRIGMGLEGLIHLRNFINAGGVFVGSNSSAEFAITNSFAYGVSLNRPGSELARRGIAAAHEDRRRDKPGRVRRARQSRDVQQQWRQLQRQRECGRRRTWRRWGSGRCRRRRARRRAGGGRPTGRGTPDDPDVVQGRPASEGSNLTPLPPQTTVQPWQYALPTEEQLKRNPVTLIPPPFRPRVAMRFDAQNSLLVSGLLDGGADIAQRPVVVDVPVGKGHVVLFANNPIYRGETIGSYFMVFNTILNFDNLDAGRKLDAK